MSVSSTNTKVSLPANGTAHSFAYNFKIFADADLQVIVRSAAGVETVKTLNTHYIVTNAGSESGGNVLFKFNTGTSSDAHFSSTDQRPQNGETVVLARNLTLTQGTDYIANDPFPAESHEDALDRLTFIAQQQQEELDRAIKSSVGNTFTSSEFTISATDRANKVFAFDGSGDLAITQELGTFRGNWAASTAYAVRDLVKDTSSNNIFIVTTAHTSTGSQPLTTNANSAKYSLIVDAASASTSQAAAASSATASANSATASANSATASANSASSASTSQTAAETAKTAAETAKTAAETAQAAAETALDTFDDRFLGAKNSDPNQDNDGNALLDGAIYFDTTLNLMKVYDQSGGQWVQLALTGTNQTNVNTVAGQISPTNNISTVASAINAGSFASATTFASQYRVGSSNPTSSLDAGDLFFNTTDNELKVYNGSSWVAATSAVNGTSVRQTYTVGSPSGGYDGSTTVFPIAYDVGFVDVYLNGVRLAGADFTASNGTSVILDTAAATGDTVDMVAFGIFNVASISAAALTSGTIPDARFPATLPAVSGANLTGINTDLASDTTPQLGGNLDVQTHSIVSTSNQDITLSPNGTGNVVMNTDNLQIIESDDSASQAPNLDLRRISSSPADNDVLGAVRFYGKDSAGNDELYGKIYAEIEDVTENTEDSSLYLQAQGNIMRLYHPNTVNRFLNFESEQILHWEAHKGTNHFCRLFWETPTQSNNIFLPNVQSGTLGYVALSTVSITSDTASLEFDNLFDEFDTFKIHINAHPVSDGVTFRARFLNTSGTEISDGTAYANYFDTDGSNTSSDSFSNMRLTATTIGSGDQEGVVADITLQGRNYTTASAEVVPPSIQGNVIGHYSNSNYSGGNFYGVLTNTNAQAIRGIKFSFSSGNIARATAHLYGIQNT